MRLFHLQTVLSKTFMPNEGTTKNENIELSHPHPVPPPSEGEGEGGGMFYLRVKLIGFSQI
jgi:hypothetical protein